MNLPKGWKLLQLKEICDLQNGYAFKSTDYVNASNTLNCRMSNIRPSGVFDLTHNPKFLPDFYAEKYSNYLLKDGDVIIAMTDMATEAKILGVPTIVKTEGKQLLLNQRVGKLIIKKPDLIFFPYLKYALNREETKLYFLKFSGGGLQINLGKNDLLSVKIPLPPIASQRTIANILDKADEIIRKRKEAIALTEQLQKSIFLDMFGDPVINPKGWEKVTVNDVVSEVKDGPHVSPEYSHNGIPILSTRNIRPNELIMEDIKYISEDVYLNLIKRFKPQKGDVLLTKGGTTGFAKVVDWDWDFAVWVHLALLRPNNKIRSEFLEATLNSPNCYLQSQLYTHGIANKDLGLNRIRKIKMCLPPLDLQDEYCQIRKKTLFLLNKNKKSLKESENLFNSLLQKAFKGEL